MPCCDMHCFRSKCEKIMKAGTSHGLKFPQFVCTHAGLHNLNAFYYVHNLVNYNMSNFKIKDQDTAKRKYCKSK